MPLQKENYKAEATWLFNFGKDYTVIANEYLMKDYLFSYGTLQKKKAQVELFGRILHGTGDILRGYKVSSVEIKDEAFLSKGEDKYQLTAISSENNNDLIKGTVFEITEEELLWADKYEPDGFKRITVVLESGKQAWIYTCPH